jgi:hypothetical protein
MAQYVVCSCRQCGSRYPGLLETTEPQGERFEAAGVCGDCLDHLFGFEEQADEGMESRNRGDGTVSED